MLILGGRGSILRPKAAALIPDPTFNSSATDNDNVFETNHDFTLSLASGTNRLLLATGLVQSGSVTFSSAVFDQGGGNQASMTLVRQTTGSSGDIIKVPLFQYFIPDGVAAGDKTIRLTASSNARIVGAAICYNNVGSPRGADDGLEAHGAQPTPLDLSANTGDLVFSVLGIDISQGSEGWAPTSGDLSPRVNIHTSNAGGIGFMTAEDLTAAPSGGVVNCGWTRGAGTPGGSVDMCVTAAVYPHL